MDLRLNNVEDKSSHFRLWEAEMWKHSHAIPLDQYDLHSNHDQLRIDAAIQFQYSPEATEHEAATELFRSRRKRIIRYKDADLRTPLTSYLVLFKRNFGTYLDTE